MNFVSSDTELVLSCNLSALCSTKRLTPVMQRFAFVHRDISRVLYSKHEQKKFRCVGLTDSTVFLKVELK
jgi:hypothetical protein